MNADCLINVFEFIVNGRLSDKFVAVEEQGCGDRREGEIMISLTLHSVELPT